MSNFYLSVLAPALCLFLGFMASGIMVFMDLTGSNFRLVSMLSIVCLPLGIILAYQAYHDFELEDKN